MTFEVLWDPKAVAQLRKLPRETAKRIIKKFRFVGETGFGLETLKEHEYGFHL